MERSRGNIVMFATHCFAWICALGAVVEASRLSEEGLYFRGVPPIPLRVNPLLLAVGLGGGAATLIVAWLLVRTFRDRGRLVAALGVGPVILAVGALVAAMHPSSGASAARDVVYTSPTSPSATTFAIPVYFENGRSALSFEEKRRLQDAFATFRDCGSGGIYVRGFASSAPFRSNSDHQNRTLANDRSAAVKEVVDRIVGGSATAVAWDEHEQMVRFRRLRDVGLHGERIRDIERLNRRAEVFWNNSWCSNPMQATTAETREVPLP